MALTQVAGGMIAPSTTLTTPIVATTMGVGGATPANTGSGISFPATQSASSDANTLDDYEEGTFTPTLVVSSGTPTYTFQNGTYTKVGRIVTCGGIIGISNSNTLTGVISIAMPFTAGGAPNGYCVGTVADGSGFSMPISAGAGNAYFISFQGGSGGNSINAYTINGAVNYNSSGVGASWYFRFQATYPAA